MARARAAVVRNRYIHKLDRDLPGQVKMTLSRIADEATLQDGPVDDAVVDFGLGAIAELAGLSENAYWKWFDKPRGGA